MRLRALRPEARGIPAPCTSPSFLTILFFPILLKIRFATSRAHGFSDVSSNRTGIGPGALAASGQTLGVSGPPIGTYIFEALNVSRNFPLEIALYFIAFDALTDLCFLRRGKVRGLAQRVNARTLEDTACARLPDTVDCGERNFKTLFRDGYTCDTHVRDC